MFRSVLTLLILLAGSGVSSPVRADEPDFLPQALALERTMQKVIAQAEPSIACILVSRSELYRKFGHAPAPDDSPGQLGTFEPAALSGLPAERKDRLTKLLDLANPAVVPESFGSGVVIGPAGFILTNYHVVRDATKIFVRLPGRKASYADIHAADPRSDLAVLRVLDPRMRNLEPIRLGDGGKLKRGQFLLSLANPFAAGFRDGQPSASWGILSNIRRRSPGQPRTEDGQRSLQHYGILLQTDARLNLGCSGGALLNLHGELVGLTTSLAAIHGGETPGGFAIPLDSGIRRIIDVLLRGEEVEYGLLGVSQRGPDLGRGIEVNCIPGSPAELEGRLKTGDRILEVNDQPIHELDDLFLQLGTQLAGTRVKLKVRRANGSEGTFDVGLAKLYVPGKRIASSTGKRPFVRGFRVDFTSILSQQPPVLQFIPAGVLVSEVQPGSSAGIARLKTGDIIVGVNGRPVRSPSDFYQAVPLMGRLELTLGGIAPNDPLTKLVIP